MLPQLEKKKMWDSRKVEKPEKKRGKMENQMSGRKTKRRGERKREKEKGNLERNASFSVDSPLI